MSEETSVEAPTTAETLFGDFAPALVHFTDDVLFGEVWDRPGHGLTESELVEAITHLAFYAGWPEAMSAMGVAKQVIGATSPTGAAAEA